MPTAGAGHCRDWRSASSDDTARYSLVSSANSLIEFSTLLGKSLIYARNRRGPSTLPWGTPLAGRY